jgi:ERCC4-type nuclease
MLLMIIKIDNRERRLITLVRNCIENSKSSTPITIEVSALPLGDVIICQDNGSECLIIERKSLQDLASSIVDGRYKEQSHRLSECEMSNHNIIYIIEGNMDSFRPVKGRIGEDSLWSAMVSLAHKKGFSVFRTISLVETATYITRLAMKYEVESKESKQEYASVVKRAKKNNIDSTNAGVIMLSQLPGISVKVARAIIDEYKSIPCLIKELESNPGRLNGLSISCENGKTRLIPKNVSKILCEYLKIEETSQSV